MKTLGIFSKITESFETEIFHKLLWNTLLAVFCSLIVTAFFTFFNQNEIKYFKSFPYIFTFFFVISNFYGDNKIIIKNKNVKRVLDIVFGICVAILLIFAFYIEGLLFIILGEG